MSSNPDTNPPEPTRLPMSRRSLLRGGTVLGVSVLTTAGLGSAPAVAGSEARAAAADPAAHLVRDYRPSQPTGAPATLGQSFAMTIGGHIPAKDFTFNGKPHRVSLLEFGQPGGSAEPFYEDTPADPAINFRRTLADAFGAYYSFRYLGGFQGRDEFRVQSYGVFATESTEASPETHFGGGLYVVYDPDLRRGDPDIHDNLQWIQVVRAIDPIAPTDSMVDNIFRANPYYPYTGLNSIYGTEVFNFHDIPQIGVMGNATLASQFMAETFLVRDTGVKDEAGKDVINVFGGIKWGWRVRELQA
jgi:hypothetical protein